MRKNNCLLSLDNAEGILVAVLSGEIDHHSAVWVRGEIDDAIASARPQRIILDLSGIDFMDSSGIGLIMGRYAKIRAIGGELCVRDPNERILKIFKMAGLEKIVSIEYSDDKGGEINEIKGN